MSSIAKFTQVHKHMIDREAEYRKQALIQAKERARADRFAMYKELSDLIRVDGVKISKVCREVGIARSTVYNWLEEYDSMSGLASDSASESPGWTEIRLMPSGEVAAIDASGDQWLLEECGDAWNKTQNKVAAFGEWPDGALDAFNGAVA